MSSRLVLVVAAVGGLLVGLGPSGAQAADDDPVAVEVGAGTESNTDWRSFDAGARYACGVRTNGRLYCWGEGFQGQVGDGGTGIQTTPVEVAGGDTDWATVTAGDSHTCARRTSGRLHCWGDDLHGQLGDGGSDTDQLTPVEVDGGHTTWTAVAAGTGHTCGIRSPGRLYCWGADSFGQLGNGGTSANRATPTQVAGGHTDWTAVTAGVSHTCARRSSGRLYCWGWDGNGRLGDGGSNATRTVPTQVAGGHTDWTAVSAGVSHTCGTRRPGRLYCWGSDGDGRLGDGGANAGRTTPTQVAGGHSNWTAVTAGLSHTCGRRGTGRLYCWGSDGDGRLGDGASNATRTVPTQVAGGNTTWVTASAGKRHTCARRSTGRLFCWGSDTYGQLGTAEAIAFEPTPVQVAATP